MYNFLTDDDGFDEVCCRVRRADLAASVIVEMLGETECKEKFLSGNGATRCGHFFYTPATHKCCGFHRACSYESVDSALLLGQIAHFFVMLKDPHEHHVDAMCEMHDGVLFAGEVVGEL